VLDRPFRIESLPSIAEWQVSEVLPPYAPPPVDWPVMVKAATQSASRE